MPNIKKVLTLSFAVLLAQAILTKAIYPVFNLNTQTLFAVTPTSGVGGTQIGDSVLGYLSGYIPFDFANFSVWIAMFLGAFVLIYAGFFLYEQKYVKLPKGKNITQRLIAILAYGHIVLFIALWLLKMNVPGVTLDLLAGVAINLLGLSVIIGLSSEKLRWPRV